MNRRKVLVTLLATPATTWSWSSVYALVRDLATTKTEAEADWIARSTLPGTIWAHDFRSDAEFTNFHKGTQSPYENNRSNPKLHPYHATLVSTPFGQSRAIKSMARGTHLIRDVPAATKGEIQVWSVADVSKIAAPWDGEYRLLVAAKEYVYIQSRDEAAGTITVRRTRSSAYPALKTTIGSGPQGRWIRPTAAFPAGENGKTEPDQGLLNGTARKPRRWDARNSRMHYKFREAYYGHRSYWDSRHGEAPFKDWTPRTETENSTRVDAWEGDEFYLQFRAKVSRSRVQSRSPSGKMLYIQNCTSSGNGQFFWRIGPRSRRTAVPPDWPYGSETGTLLVGNTCYGDFTAKFGGTLSSPATNGFATATHKWLDGEIDVVRYQDETHWPDARYRGDKNPIVGWHVPVEKWVTYLVHIKPGRDSVVQYAQSTLVKPVVSRDYSDKSRDVLYLEDVSGFPDVEGEGGYPYIVHTGRSHAPMLHEHMRVVEIDRRINTLTVERNISRDWLNITVRNDWIIPDGAGKVRNVKLGWEAGAIIAYGPYEGFPKDRRGGRVELKWPVGVRYDKRLQYRETTVEILVAVDGESEYKTITSSDKFAWLFGDLKGNFLNYSYNPPGLNSIELSQYLNDYVGSGSVAPPSGEHDIQYTQVIFSRNFIPVPGVRS